MKQSRILIVDDDENLRWVTKTQLEDAGYEVSEAADGESALASLNAEHPELVITDLKMPGMSGLELLRRIRSADPEIPVLMITAFGSIRSAVEAVREGAYDYLTKPLDHDELLLAVQRALDHTRLIAEVDNLRENLDRKYGFENIIGNSDALMAALDMARRAARTNSTVLIHAETGTGKELLARAIHLNSQRRERPFVTINCGAIPRDLLESELFGHVKGSFTGAMASKKGRIEMADTGTLFLDEIGEMPPELQVKLLRLIQQGEIDKVGATEPIRVDVRILAATHRNLKAMIEDGAFREDLYYRLAVIPLGLPPLRERLDDIPDLVQHFFLRARDKVERPGAVLPPSLISYFQAYSWPGNIRELENVIERVVVLSREDEITVADLPDFLRERQPVSDSLQLSLPNGGVSLEAVEKELIEKALTRFNWNQTHAARYLDISRKALTYRMEKHGIRRPDGRSADESDDGVPL